MANAFLTGLGGRRYTCCGAIGRAARDRCRIGHFAFTGFPLQIRLPAMLRPWRACTFGCGARVREGPCSKTSKQGLNIGESMRRTSACRSICRNYTFLADDRSLAAARPKK